MSDLEELRAPWNLRGLWGPLENVGLVGLVGPVTHVGPGPVRIAGVLDLWGMWDLRAPWVVWDLLTPWNLWGMLDLCDL